MKKSWKAGGLRSNLFTTTPVPFPRLFRIYGSIFMLILHFSSVIGHSGSHLAVGPAWLCKKKGLVAKLETKDELGVVYKEMVSLMYRCRGGSSTWMGQLWQPRKFGNLMNRTDGSKESDCKKSLFQ